MRILFFTPFAERFGSEVSLVNLLTHMDRDNFEGYLFSKSNGVLLPELPKDIKSSYSSLHYSTIGNKIANRVNKMTTNRTLQESQIEKINSEYKPDLWYLNTMVMPEIAELAKKLKVPYVVHFHELLSVFESMKDRTFEGMVQNASLLIGCSEIVCKKLAAMGPKNIELHHENIDIGLISPDASRKEALRAKLQLAEGSYTWAMSGGTSYRKGLDLFMEIALAFKDKPVNFIWLGRQRDHGFNYYVDKAIEQHGLTNVHLLDEQVDDYYSYLDLCDGFLLSSREDPFPLVMIEAAYLKKPIAAFNSGGVKEFVQQGMGSVVEGISVDPLVLEMQKIMDGTTQIDPELLHTRSREFATEVQVKLWEKILMTHFKER